jgi:hypothetical protein
MDDAWGRLTIVPTTDLRIWAVHPKEQEAKSECEQLGDTDDRAKRGDIWFRYHCPDGVGTGAYTRSSVLLGDWYLSRSHPALRIAGMGQRYMTLTEEVEVVPTEVALTLR